jgi:predicted nucleotidyltransferase component of viral defense system
MALPILENFNLVGGTALSLLYGHRQSVDLDLFTSNKLQNDEILELLATEYGSAFEIRRNANIGIFNYIHNIKVDLVYYPHRILFPVQTIDNIRMLDPRDICAMKAQAILGRGKKKDFWDIAELSQHYTLKEFIAFHEEKFPNQNLLISIPQALLFFDDADEGEDPISLKGQTWQSIQHTLQAWVEVYLR